MEGNKESSSKEVPKDEKKVEEEKVESKITAHEDPKEEQKKEGGEANPEVPSEEKKKKKKKKHKKHGKGNKPDDANRENPYRSLFNFDPKDVSPSRKQDNSQFRILGSWEEKPWLQTTPPTKSIDEQFPNKDWPIGVIMEYGQNDIWRSTDKEKIEQERLREYDIIALRKAAECHRQIRKFAQSVMKPGMKMVDICVQIENMLKFIINANGLECGQAFPTGCSLNHVAAHYTPNPGDETVLNYNDVCKIDFGTHVNGLIIDCAFTVAFNPIYDNLLMASREATRQGVKLAGIDGRLGEIGAGIQEVIESYEVEIGGKTHKIKAVKNLCGHTIEPFKIHAGKSVPIVKKDDNTKMEEGEIYAIETFASTGKGNVLESGECSHYMKDEYAIESAKIKGDKPRALFNYIDKHFSTMAFCRRWLAEGGFPQHALALRQLIDGGLVNPYPPLADIEGCYVSQFEHTLMLKPTSKEVFSIGDDY